VHSVITRQTRETRQTKQTQMGTKKRIGVKYCGGCNPGYERVEMVDRIQFRFNDRFSFLRYDEPDITMLVLMNGCQRTCASQDLNPTGVPHFSVTGENDFKDLIDWLTSIHEKGDF